MKTKNLLPGILILFILFSGSKTLMAQKSVQVTSQKFIAYSLYNFSKYVEWPSSSTVKTFRISVVGDKAVYESLQKLAVNKSIVNAHYEIIYCKNTDDLSPGNHIVYLSNMHSGKVKKISQNPHFKNVMLVTEREKMAKYGSTISFTVSEEGLMGFEIAKMNAIKSQLSINSQLERMAIAVL